MKMNVKPGLHIVVTVAEHACNDASKRILKLSIYPLQIFLENSNSCDHRNKMGTKPYLDILKTCSQTSACDPCN